MKRLYVYADFDWLKEIELIGELGYESLRGSDSYSFLFHDEWLRKHGDLFLSEDMNNYPGMQYTQPGKDIFGCFSDALPDRWGRTLLLRREQIAASEEDACEEYMIGRKVAEGIIREVVGAVKEWRSIAIRTGISKREMEMFADVLDRA